MVDPDPHKIYSRRKERQGTSSEPDADSNESAQFPSSGWKTVGKMLSLSQCPIYSSIQSRERRDLFVGNSWIK